MFFYAEWICRFFWAADFKYGFELELFVQVY
jgi:hypothetical protein